MVIDVRARRLLNWELVTEHNKSDATRVCRRNTVTTRLLRGSLVSARAVCVADWRRQGRWLARRRNFENTAPTFSRTLNVQTTRRQHPGTCYKLNTHRAVYSAAYNNQARHRRGPTARRHMEQHHDSASHPTRASRTPRRTASCPARACRSVPRRPVVDDWLVR